MGENARLIECLCLAPKHYSLRVEVNAEGGDEEREVSKIKGYTQKLEFQETFNFASTKRMIFDSELRETLISFNELKRDKKNLHIMDIDKEKKIHATFDKRIVDLTTLKTYPIGYYYCG